MTKLKLNNTYLPLIFIFVSVNALCVIFNDKLDAYHINHLVVQGANLLLFVLMTISAYLHFKALRSSNPHAFLRSVLSATVIKLFVIAGATFIYLFAAGEQRSVYAVLVGMVLYIIYTAVELRGLFRMNKQNNNVKS
ncbi:hypothetical protein FC093_09040 [Ilyomonas limi]|uniref:Uncharacterized protein n=1 Tax=Ilyomonas limi TaxID=2575867 RepID=A0A4U3L133_9BACT|nr:hypothetical protein [Ilyomonas limi]TKK68831.1 hypothetical protein FC093_09040 [Ilyomonas limi]